MAHGELEKLTVGERLAVQRRRFGERQKAAAQRHGVSHTRYSRWERGIEQPGPDVVKSLKIGQLKPHEYCFLYRRRAGFTQERVAGEMKVCRYWLNRMELGEADCTDLLCYWEA